MSSTDFNIPKTINTKQKSNNKKVLVIKSSGIGLFIILTILHLTVGLTNIPHMFVSDEAELKNEEMLNKRLATLSNKVISSNRPTQNNDALPKMPIGKISNRFQDVSVKSNNTLEPSQPIRPDSKSLDLVNNDALPPFVIAPDYKRALAVFMMLDKAINPEIESQWINLKLQVNAERERNRLAQIQLQRAKAESQSAKLQAETIQLIKEVERNGDDVLQLASTKIRAPNVEVLSVMNNGTQVKADVIIDGELFEEIQMGSSTGNLYVKSISIVKKCVIFEADNSSNLTKCM
jgi:hypothetical protein